ncbi:mitochondrial 39-S ribosomal protein L47 (MRP-L47)-domain-containing protein [Sphaerosporella brunnea]|uniref:Large ribosomal subunit protein uL29m n=1 Tax=Sphaerosporella brunnea TaxID=1250544 RepID=A0A5J5ERJ1_9PEZI|nr:mitochondrial 39-S ribosomal protein L47 (MRP-L47)-domain-containing protein [Sphaerosporella brunnea]
MSLRPVLYRRFSTCRTLSYPRITRDRNPNRGVSPLRHQAAKEPLSTEKYPLPVPAPVTSKIVTDPDHGLWGFFRDKQPLPTPEEDHAHGRHWTVAELRNKSWEDLHRLWWTCVKERNIIATQMAERKRLNPGYGEHEAQEREKVVLRTQRSIKHVLTERYYAWEEAKKLAEKDPEINLSGEGPLINVPSS